MIYLRLSIIFICFASLFGCRRDRVVSDVPMVATSDSFNGVYPSIEIPGKIAEYKGRLDTSGLVQLNENGQIQAYIHDVNTWFRVAVNRQSNAAYVLYSDKTVQYQNFYGQRPYYIVVYN